VFAQFARPNRPQLENVRVHRGTVARAFEFLRPYRVQFVFYALLLALAAVAGTFPAILLRRMIDDAVPKGDHGQVAVLAIASIAGYVTAGALTVAAGWLGTVMGTRLILDLRTSLYDNLQRLPQAFFVRSRAGAIQSRLNNDVLNAQQLFTGQMFTGSAGSLVADILTLGVTTGAMLLLSWQLTLLVLLFVPFFLLPARLATRRATHLTREQLELYADLNIFAVERLDVAGALLVRLFGGQRRERAGFRERAAKLRRNNIRVNTLSVTFGAALALMSSLSASTRRSST
jgi:ATP-binding cassette, subfamily B, bacterial